MIKTSIIIPIKGREGLTIACLKSLSKCDSVRIKEVILVDNGSEESNDKFSDGFYWEKLKVISGERPLNFSESCNFGVKQATAETLLFLNNDITVSGQWLGSLLEALEINGGIVGAKLLYPDGVIQHAGEVFPMWGTPFIGASGAPADFIDYQGVRKRWGVIAACLMMHKKLFEKVGGFDEKYNFGFEDIDLCFKAWEIGVAINCVGSVCIYHHEAGTISHVPDDIKSKRDHDNIIRFRNRWGTLTDRLAHKFINSLKNENIRNVTIYGSGEAARMCSKLLQARGIKVSCLIEAEERYFGMVVDGVRVKPLSEVSNNIECILIASQFQWRIKKILDDANLLNFVRSIELCDDAWAPGDI